MTISFRPAVRQNVPLLLSVAGSTGSGKTYSALRLASGISAGKPFAVIDTENGRASHYAEQFRFEVADLAAPFTPRAYMEAIDAAAAAGYGVIVVDSMSHEHAGDGGLLDMHDAELDRMAGTDQRKRDAVSMAAWTRPKAEHKRLVSRLLQLRAHVIFCFRAEPKVEMVRVDGKWVIQPKQSLVGLDGWIPISEKNLPYEMTVSMLMMADQPGVPKPIKVPEQLKPLIPLDQPLTEQVGAALAEWAAGAPKADTPEIAALKDELMKAAEVIGKVEQTRAWLDAHTRTAAAIRGQITRAHNTATKQGDQGQLAETAA